MFYEYQSPHQTFRLVCWWTSGTLGSWLTLGSPLRALEKLVQGPGCQVLCTSKSLSGLHLLSQSFSVPLSLASVRLPCSLSCPHPQAAVVAPVTGAHSWQNYFPLCWVSISQ